MAYNDDILNKIYDRNNGYCWHCGKKLSFINYGIIGARGAWEVDHSKPKSRGGTNHLNTLLYLSFLLKRSFSRKTDTKIMIKPMARKATPNFKTIGSLLS